MSKYDLLQIKYKSEQQQFTNWPGPPGPPWWPPLPPPGPSCPRGGTATFSLIRCIACWIWSGLPRIRNSLSGPGGALRFSSTCAPDISQIALMFSPPTRYQQEDVITCWYIDKDQCNTLWKHGWPTGLHVNTIRRVLCIIFKLGFQSCYQLRARIDNSAQNRPLVHYCTVNPQRDSSIDAV